VQNQEPKKTKYLRIASVAARVIGSIGMACCGPSCLLEFPTSFELAVISHAATAKIHARAAQEMKSLCMEALSAQFCPPNIGFHCFPPRTALATIRATGALINSTAITLLEKSTAAAHNAIVDALDSQLIHHAANIAITVASYATYICGANIQAIPPYAPPVIPLPNPWKDENIAITTHTSSGDEQKKRQRINQQ
jgi:hypothetical protein